MSFTQEITLRTIRQRLDYLKTKREQVVAESKKEPLSDRVSFSTLRSIFLKEGNCGNTVLC